MSACGFCLVTVQNGREFVSTVAVSAEDADRLLAIDTLLHRAAGWLVTEGQREVIARRGNVVRLVSARPLALDARGGNENCVIARTDRSARREPKGAKQFSSLIAQTEPALGGSWR